MFSNANINQNRERLQPIIETKSLKNIGEKLKQTITKNDWLAIAGQSGTGKSTAMRHHLEYYSQKSKYIIVNYEGILQHKDQTNSIMRACIKKLLPGEKVAQDVFARYTQFQRALISNQQEGKKLILKINEAHRLSQDTFYGIKMLHEAGQDYYEEHLFPIVMIGQPALQGKTINPELNFRIRRFQMAQLNLKEAQTLLKVNNYTCNMSTLKSIFRNSLSTPSGIYHYINLFKEKLGIAEGEITVDHMYSLTGVSIKDSMLKYNISNQEFADSASKVIGQPVSSSFVSKMRNEKIEGEKVDTIVVRTAEIFKECLSKKQESPNVERNMA